MPEQNYRYIGSEIAHSCAKSQVIGEAVFVNDIKLPEPALHIYVYPSDITAGTIKRCQLDKVRQHKEVALVVDANDISGKNNIGLTAADGPIFAEKNILFNAQPLFAVAATSTQIARAAAQSADIKYKDKTQPLITIEQAKKIKSALVKGVEIKRGRSSPAIKNAAHRLEGTISIAGQEHFYLEGQATIALIKDDKLYVYCATQHPCLVQHLIASALAIESHMVIVESKQLGGSFGGKQSQAAHWAIIAALVAFKTKKPAVLSLDRTNDLAMTGKSHDYLVEYKAGYNDAGIIDGVEVLVMARCGALLGSSAAINENMLLHIDNCYYLKNVTLTSKNLKTDTVPCSPLRGFGAAQGVLVIERIIDEIATHLRLDPLAVRLSNLYGTTTRNITHYGMKLKDNDLEQMIGELRKTSTYLKRRKVINNFNQNSPVIKRGIGFVPVKLGCCFNRNNADQSQAHIHVDEQGQIEVSHCGVERGQGLYTKIEQIVAEVLQVDPGHVSSHTLTTDRISDNSVKGVCDSALVNAMAVQIAAEKIKRRLLEFAMDHYSVSKSKITFAPEGVRIGRKTVQLKTLVAQAHSADVKLSAKGFYTLPGTSFDMSQKKGRPYDYFCYGCAVCEVAVDCLTGETEIVRVDILQDSGQSINPAIDMGQIEGGFVQGLGWLTLEQLLWNDAGQLLTNSASNYKIPTCADAPQKFSTRIWNNGNHNESMLYNSKSLGQVPYILAISAYSALSHALAAASVKDRPLPRLDTPATPERILLAIHHN